MILGHSNPPYQPRSTVAYASRPSRCSLLVLEYRGNEGVTKFPPPPSSSILQNQIFGGALLGARPPVHLNQRLTALASCVPMRSAVAVRRTECRVPQPSFETNCSISKSEFRATIPQCLQMTSSAEG